MSYGLTQRVKFNVGGTIFETTRSTLDKLRSEYLEDILDRWTEARQPQTYFIDRDPDCFRVFLNIARYGEVSLNDTKINFELLESEADFYMLDDYFHNLIATYKKKITSEKTPRSKTTIASNGDAGARLSIGLDLTVDDFNSGKCDFLYHHVRLKAVTKKNRWVCCSDDDCKVTLPDGVQGVVCCRCKFTTKINEFSEFRAWCHRCRRCLRCAETICMPVKMN